MSMSKQDFIALANEIRDCNRTADNSDMPQYRFSPTQINVLAAFCKSQNSNFNRERWLDYIAGKWWLFWVGD